VRGFNHLTSITLRENGAFKLMQSGVVDTLSLEVLKTRLDGAPGNMVKYQTWRLVALSVEGALELDDPWGPFQSKPFYDSSILQLGY